MLSSFTQRTTPTDSNIEEVSTSPISRYRLRPGTREKEIAMCLENEVNAEAVVAHIPDSVYRIPEPDKEYRISDTG